MGRMAERYSMSGKPKKRKADLETSINISEDVLVRLVEKTMARILRDFVTPTPATSLREGVQTLRNEINENINKVQIQLTHFVNTAMAKVQVEADRRADAMAKAQAEADRRADAMFQKLAQMLETALRNDKDRATPFVRADVTQGSARQPHAVQGRQ
jgi:hypothetical protein